MPDCDLIKTSQGFRAVAGNKEKVVRIYGGQYTNSGSCSHTQLNPRSGLGDLVTDDSIPIEDSLFEFGVLSPGLCRDERDLIVHQHDRPNWQ